MAADVVPLPGGQIAHGAEIVDHFAIAAAPAKQTLDAVITLRKARNWLAAHEQRDPHHHRLLLDADKAYELVDLAKERLGMIPETTALQHAKQLFRDAECVPAPEPWYHLAFGAMLAGRPNSRNVPPDYQFGLVDSILHDEALWETYDPGFSCPVVVYAIREARRASDFVPAPATLLKACQQYRRKFRDLQWTVDLLMQVRTNAEEVVKEDESWGFKEPFEPRPPGWRPPVYPDDGDCPF